MKQLLPLLLFLLLCGCTREPAALPDATAATAAMTEPQPSTLELHAPQCQGTLTGYPLSLPGTREVCAVPQGLLLLSGEDNTLLSLATGDPLSVTASLELDFYVEARQIQMGEDHISLYDPKGQQVLVLGPELQIQQKLPFSEPVQGNPLLSPDSSTLYYATDTAIFAWDLESGIHRTVAEFSYDSQELTGLHWDQTVLQCRIRDAGETATLFLRADTGKLLTRQEGDVQLLTAPDRYYALLPLGALEMPVFGQEGSLPQALYPEDTASACFFLPTIHSALTVSSGEDGCPVLRLYELSSGAFRAQLSLEPLQSPKSVTTDRQGRIWFLTYDPAQDRDTLCCWDSFREPFLPHSDTTYTGIYQGEDSQAPETLARCRETAAGFQEAYGITVLIGEDAVQTAPWDYSLQAETLPQVLSAELTLLDQRLSRFPAEILQKTAAHFSSVNLCLVRSITGTAQAAALDTATGIQFLEGEDAYVVIAVGKYSQQALYHELYHLMEILIYARSTALDPWNALNPPSFSYTFGLGDPEAEEGYLTGKTRAFVDLYSMTYPKEDRARVWETALLPGNEEVFASETMQSKLTALCKGVREAYGLTKVKEVFPWEQYLTYPMVHGG